MNAFQRYTKKLETYPNLPPTIALYFKFNFLEIELTKAQDKEFDDWFCANKANKRLFEHLLTYRVSKVGKPLTPEQKIREVAAYATITPQAIELLDKFFQDTATGPDKDEIDEWLHISPANDQLFELLVLLNIEPAEPGTISRVKKLLLPEA